MIKCNEHAIGETSIIFDVITTHSATLQKKIGKPHRRNPKKWKAQSHKKIMIKIDLVSTKCGTAQNVAPISHRKSSIYIVKWAELSCSEGT